MVTTQEKQALCIDYLETLANCVTKIGSWDFSRFSSQGPEYPLTVVPSDTHSIRLTIVTPHIANNNSSSIILDVISNKSNLVQHCIWLSIEPSVNGATYFGYSTPFFRGKPKEWDRVGSRSSDLSALYNPRLIVEGITSDAILGALYIGLPRVLVKFEQTTGFTII